MKKLLVFLLFLSPVLKSQVRLDTLINQYVGPGTIYTKIKAPSMPWDINVLRVDLKNQYIKIESAKAKDLYAGLERTSYMASRKTYSGHEVIGAVNGDFYNTGNGQPINVQIANGEFVRIPSSLSTVGFDISNKPMLGIVAFKGKVIANGVSRDINNINVTRNTDQLIMYNSFNGSSSGTNAYGTEALVRPVKGWIVNDTVLCVVEKIENSIGNMAFDKGKAVLSGHGASAAFISANLHAGDTIKVVQSVTPALDKLKEMMGGYPKIVYKGLNYAEQGFKEEGGPDHAHNREPRTAVGYSADSTYLYLVTLDGRGASIGATLPELADVMIQLGVAYGMNFDGGGSTTMVVKGSIMNFTSDGRERSVANSLQVVSSAPSVPDSLRKVSFKYLYNKLSIYSLDAIQLEAYGNDLYNNIVSPDPSLLEFSADPQLGTVTKSGLFTAAKQASKGYIYLKYKGFSDSCLISITPVTKIVLSPKTSLIDASGAITCSVKGYTSTNIERTLKPGDLLWKSSDTSIAAVDPSGVIRGKAEGKVKITAFFLNNIADSADVTVQIGRGVILSDAMESLTGWTLSGVGLVMDSTKVTVSSDKKSEGSASFKIDYQFIYNPSVSSLIYLACSIPFYGLPDSLLVDARTSSSSADKIFYIVLNQDNKSFKLTASGDITSSDKFGSVSTSFKNYTALNSGTFSYPLKLQRIVIQPQYNDTKLVSGEKYSGTIYLDNLRIKYPLPTVSVGKENNLPAEFSLQQNYPNPFNPSTVIEFNTPVEENVTLKIFDLLGREVATLINSRLQPGKHSVEWSAAENPSGIYLYRLQYGSYSQTRKMLLLR